MRTAILWTHMLLCAVWTVFLLIYATIGADEAFSSPEIAIPVLLGLATSASGLYLFLSHAFRTRSRESELKRQNAILKREIEQEELKTKLKTLKKDSSEPES